jgi:hypothetical protein
MSDLDFIEDQTVEDRLISAFLACALPIGWYLLGPDYAELARTPLDKVTLGAIAYAVGWGLLLIPVGRAVISFVYQAVYSLLAI